MLKKLMEFSSVLALLVAIGASVQGVYELPLAIKILIVWLLAGYALWDISQRLGERSKPAAPFPGRQLARPSLRFPYLAIIALSGLFISTSILVTSISSAMIVDRQDGTFRLLAPRLAITRLTIDLVGSARSDCRITKAFGEGIEISHVVTGTSGYEYHLWNFQNPQALEFGCDLEENSSKIAYKDIPSDRVVWKQTSVLLLDLASIAMGALLCAASLYRVRRFSSPGF